jgi:hypothetical protein
MKRGVFIFFSCIFCGEQILNRESQKARPKEATRKKARCS